MSFTNKELCQGFQRRAMKATEGQRERPGNGTGATYKTGKILSGSKPRHAVKQPFTMKSSNEDRSYRISHAGKKYKGNKFSLNGITK